VIFYVIQLQELVIGQVWHVARMLHFSKWKLAKIIGGRLPPPPLPLAPPSFRHCTWWEKLIFYA
jgi:hypothetical protein